MLIYYTLWCSFNPKTGWRVFLSTDSFFLPPPICVVTACGQKYLQIPALETWVRGRFCNPKTLALNTVKGRAALRQISPARLAA